MLRLGDVVSAYGSIPPTAADQAVATVRRFRLLADAAGVDEIHARATSAIRRAENGGELVDRIEDETGVAVDVISGLEEARLIFGAVRAAVVLDPAPARVLRPRWGQPRGDDRRFERAHVGHERPARCRAPEHRAGAFRSDLESGSPRRCGRVSPTCSRRWRGTPSNSSPSSRSGAAAPSRTSRPWSPRGATKTHPPRSTSSPSGVKSSSRSTRCCSTPRRPNGCGSTASTPAASTSSSRDRCSSPLRWSSSTSTASPSASGRCAKASCSTRSDATTPPTGRTTHARSVGSPC